MNPITGYAVIKGESSSLRSRPRVYEKSHKTIKILTYKPQPQTPHNFGKLFSTQDVDAAKA